jgi:hypothetical protein
MSQPFISIATLRIKEGKLEDFTRSYREVVEPSKNTNHESSPSTGSSTKTARR